MKNKKVSVAIVMALMVCFSATAFAGGHHGGGRHGGGHCGGGYRASYDNSAAPRGYANDGYVQSNGRHSVCNRLECYRTSEHAHSNGVTYAGHHNGDGHDYHEFCNVAGCAIGEFHMHNDVGYFGHHAGDGHARCY